MHLQGRSRRNPYTLHQAVKRYLAFCVLSALSLTVITKNWPVYCEGYYQKKNKTNDYAETIIVVNPYTQLL